MNKTVFFTLVISKNGKEEKEKEKQQKENTTTDHRLPSFFHLVYSHIISFHTKRIDTHTKHGKDLGMVVGKWF